MDAVAIDDVTKTYGAQTAVDRLTLRVPKGSVYGFIGPNGSGKSTTLRMVMRIIMPDSGHIRVLGEESFEAANDRIGYLPEERGLYKKMKVRDVLKFHGELKGMRDPGPAADQWLAKLGLADAASKRVEQCSKGMAQKAQFIATVIADPELVILDEPFSGLDPVNMDVVRDAILEMRDRGATIIFSTHDMAMAEQMCDFIFMIYKGKKVLDGTLASIKATYAADTVRVRFAEDVDGSLSRLTGVEKVVDHGNLKELRVASKANTRQLMSELNGLGSLELFEIVRPSLHDIFVRIAAPQMETETHA